MFPFFPSLPNQIRPQGTNDLSSQQGVLPNPLQYPSSSCINHNNNTNSGGLGNPNQMPTRLHALNNQFQQQPLAVAAAAVAAAFNNQNIHLGNGMLSHPLLMPPSCFPNNGANVLPLMLQNGLLGMQQPHPNSYNSLHQAQNLNPMATGVPFQGQFYNASQHVPGQYGQFNVQGMWPQNMPQNVNQFMGQQGQFCSQNPMLPANNFMPQQCMQNPLGSAQNVPFNNNNPQSSQPMIPGSCSSSSLLTADVAQRKNPDQKNPAEVMSMGWNARKESTHGADSASFQNLQQLITPHPTQLQQARMNLKSGGCQRPQENYTENSGSGISNVSVSNSSNHNFSRSPHGFWKRDQSQKRIQKPQLHHLANKGNFRSFTGNRGPQNGRERNHQPARFNAHSNGASRRLLPVNYTEQEIKQWREARRRNYPTATKMEKKLGGSDGNGEVIDGDAKIRRQQLKEILAKQAELGVEVAEVPPDYLSDPENHTQERGGRKRHDGKARFQNKNNKRGRQGRDNRRAKRQKPGDDAVPVSVPVPIKRSPTLLQKLLSADIQRDKSKLLQVFRFMTLNSFFEHWPDKPLQFPVVTVKDAAYNVGKNTRGAGQSLVEVVECTEDHRAVDKAKVVEKDGDSDNSSSSSDSDDEEEEVVVCEQSDKSEEGEITD